MSAGLDTTFQFVVGLAQFLLDAFAFASFGNERGHGIVQPQSLAAVGSAQCGENRNDQDRTHDAVNLRRLDHLQRMARIHEPIKDSEKSYESAEDCRYVSAHDGAIGDGNVDRHVERYMAEKGI